jgi:hypothetical protein
MVSHSNAFPFKTPSAPLDGEKIPGDFESHLIQTIGGGLLVDEIDPQTSDVELKHCISIPEDSDIQN